MVEVRVGGRERGDSLLLMHVSRVNWLPGDLSHCPLPALWHFKAAKQDWVPVLLHQFTVLLIQHINVKLPLDTGGSSLPATSNVTSVSSTRTLPIFLVPISLVLIALLVRKTDSKTWNAKHYLFRCLFLVERNGVSLNFRILGFAR